MGFTLKAVNGSVVDCNAWNWQPTVELLDGHGLLEEVTAIMLHYTAGHRVDAGTAERIATFLDGYLAQLPDQARVRLDGSVTTEIDTFEFHADDLARNYSATAAWLADFRDFCRASGGFAVH